MSFSLRRMAESDLEMVMNWRMQPDVTKYMNTDPVLTLEGQKKWFERVKANSDVGYWIIEVDSKPAGVFNLDGINSTDGQIHYAYYVGEKTLRSISLAISLEMSMYDYVFEVLGKTSVYADVFTANRGVIALHELCGGKVTEILKDHVEKNGKKYDVAVVITNRSDWEEAKKDAEYEKIDFGA